MTKYEEVQVLVMNETQGDVYYGTAVLEGQFGIWIVEEEGSDWKHFYPYTNLRELRVKEYEESAHRKEKDHASS